MAAESASGIPFTQINRDNRSSKSILDSDGEDVSTDRSKKSKGGERSDEELRKRSKDSNYESEDEGLGFKKRKTGCEFSVKGGIAMILFWVIILFLAAMLIFYLIKPSFVLKPGTEQIEWGKSSLASAVFALIGIIIIWLIMSCI